MAKRYAFTRERDVRRALKTSRLVLDRRVMQPAKFARGPVFPVSETQIQNGGGTCPCGTQYERGSVTLTWDGVDVEFATTYTVNWSEFPEVTHIGGGVWESDAAVLDDCYGGTRESKLRITPIEPPSMTPGNFVGGVITFAAKAEVISTANTCTGVDDDLANIEAKFICDNFANLATSTFELAPYTRTGEYQFPCTICVAPMVATTCASTAADWSLPSMWEVSITGTYAGNAYDQTVIVPDVGTTGGPDCDAFYCQFAKNNLQDCGGGAFEQWEVLVRDYCTVAEGGDGDPSMASGSLLLSVQTLNFECDAQPWPDWVVYLSGGPFAVPSEISLGNWTDLGNNLACVIRPIYV